LKTAVRWGWLRLRRRNHEEKYPAFHPTARSGERRELPIGVPEEPGRQYLTHTVW